MFKHFYNSTKLNNESSSNDNQLQNVALLSAQINVEQLVPKNKSQSFVVCAEILLMNKNNNPPLCLNLYPTVNQSPNPLWCQN